MAAVLLGILSFVIVWCEATFSIQQYRLSVFAQIIYVLHGLHNYYNYFLVEVREAAVLDMILDSKLSLLPSLSLSLSLSPPLLPLKVISVGIVAYMSICTYFTVFRIKIFNLYYLAPRHSTDEYSLLFSAV